MSRHLIMDEIKEKYKLVKSKARFFEALADYFHMSPQTFRNHWFSNHWRIPAGKQERCLLFLEHYLHKQDKG